MTSLDPLPLKSLSTGDTQAATLFRELTQQSKGPPAQAPQDRVRELEQMLAEVQDRTAALEREAYDKAYAAGEKAGLALGQKRAEQLLEQMQQVLQRAEGELAQMRTSFVEAALDTAMALCQWLLGEMGDEMRERLLAKAEAAAHSLPEMTGFILAVPAEEFARFERLLAGKKLATALIADTNLSPGSVRIFGKQHDVLIDPQVALAEGVKAIKAELAGGEACNRA